MHDREIPVVDLGCNSEDSVDYPDYAIKVAQGVASGEFDRGILVCGTGIGMAIAANKIKGIRAAALVDLFSAEMTRKHNDLNVLCLGGRVLDTEVTKEIVRLFVDVEFEGDRHQKRLDKIHQLEG